MNRKLHTIKLDLSDKALAMLARLVETGLFGLNVDDVARRLVDDRLRQLQDEGWLPRTIR